jgi:hypothetical protein
VRRNLQGENAIRDDIHNDRLGESLRLSHHDGFQGGLVQGLCVRLRSKSGRILLASVSRQGLVRVGRARANAGRQILDVLLSVKKSLLLGRAASSVTASNSTEPAGEVISNLTSTVSLGLLLSMGLIQEEKPNDDSEENSGGAEKIREEVGISVPDGSTSEDLGVANAWSCESSSNHRPNDRSK